MPPHRSLFPLGLLLLLLLLQLHPWVGGAGVDPLPRFICTPLPPDIDPHSPYSCPTPPSSSLHVEQQQQQQEEEGGGSLHEEGARRIILQLREALVQQREAALEQREAARELAAKLARCQAHGPHAVSQQEEEEEEEEEKGVRRVLEGLRKQLQQLQAGNNSGLGQALQHQVGLLELQLRPHRSLRASGHHGHLHGHHHGDPGKHHSDHGHHHGDPGKHHGDHSHHHGDHGHHHGDHGHHEKQVHHPHGHHHSDKLDHHSLLLGHHYHQHNDHSKAGDHSGHHKGLHGHHHHSTSGGDHYKKQDHHPEEQNGQHHHHGDHGKASDHHGGHHRGLLGNQLSPHGDHHEKQGQHNHLLGHHHSHHHSDNHGHHHHSKASDHGGHHSPPGGHHYHHSGPPGDHDKASGGHHKGLVGHPLGGGGVLLGNQSKGGGHGAPSPSSLHSNHVGPHWGKLGHQPSDPFQEHPQLFSSHRGNRVHQQPWATGQSPQEEEEEEEERGGEEEEEEEEDEDPQERVGPRDPQNNKGFRGSPGGGFRLSFPLRTNYMFARLRGPLRRPLGALSLCLWLRPGGGPPLGTPFSYAAPGQPNELVLLAWGGRPMELLVDDQAVPLALTPTPGRWHHLCVTWAAAGGTWRSFQDGVPRGRGGGLAAGHPLRPHGILVLGQEQDTLGGGFDASQAFVGDLAELQLWGRVLGATEVAAVASCSHRPAGDLLTWAQGGLELHGGVTALPFDPCS